MARWSGYGVRLTDHQVIRSGAHRVRVDGSLITMGRMGQRVSTGSGSGSSLLVGTDSSVISAGSVISAFSVGSGTSVCGSDSSAPRLPDVGGTRGKSILESVTVYGVPCVEVSSCGDIAVRVHECSRCLRHGIRTAGSLLVWILFLDAQPVTMDETMSEIGQTV